jgi:hypothetical protein
VVKRAMRLMTIHASPQSKGAATPKLAPSRSLLFQRKCACGNRTVAGGECDRCSNKNMAGLQTKLCINEPGDAYEREADRIAEQVSAKPAHPEVATAPPRIQRLAAPSSQQTSAAPPSVARALADPGRPLGPALRREMEQRFGHDFSRVRVHSGAVADQSARDVNAHAYTVGRDIVFGAGRFAPGTRDGRRLIAHELTHVVQQAQGGDAPPVARRRLQRNGPDPAPVSMDLTQPSTTAAKEPPPAPFGEVRPGGRGQVQRIVISCRDKRLRLETTSGVWLYKLIECELPLGSYNPTVTIAGDDFVLDFAEAVSGERRETFHFQYTVEEGQLNPAVLLADQGTVQVDVVDHVPAGSAAKKGQRERERGARCLVRAADRVLVPADSFSKPLFTPQKFRRVLWSHDIPLGLFGWIEVSAKAFGDLSGTFSASYGPGRLSDVCLTYLAERDTEGDPLDPDGPTTYSVGGRAKFSLPARATVRVAGRGGIRIAGEALSLIEVAAAEGVLSASGSASLSGSIDGAVDVVAQLTRPAVDVAHPIQSLRTLVEQSTIDDVNLSAKIGLRGRAGLTFRVDVSAAFDLLGHNLWRQSWNLADFHPSIAWSGGLVYSPNPGPYWDLGGFGTGTDSPDDEVIADEAGDQWLESVDGTDDSAEVDTDDVVDALLDEDQARVQIPNGLSEDNALPFEWRKPLELYPEVLEIPNAEDPKELNRDSGPTEVRFTTGGSSDRVELGVADWPSVGRTFQFLPYDERDTPEQGRFNRLLDRLGADRSGVDAEHVWDVNLRGLEYDRFDNLWPASNQDQQLAGGQHERQIANYRDTIDREDPEDSAGPLEGRWLEIIRVRHPALGE